MRFVEKCCEGRRLGDFPERCYGKLRCWYETSGGRLTDWCAHHVDIAHWGLESVMAFQRIGREQADIAALCVRFVDGLLFCKRPAIPRISKIWRKVLRCMPQIACVTLCSVRLLATFPAVVESLLLSARGHGRHLGNHFFDIQTRFEARPLTIIRPRILVASLICLLGGTPLFNDRAVAREAVAAARLNQTEQETAPEGHWAFVAPHKSAFPRGDTLEPLDNVHPIDRFIDRRLRSEGLQRSPQADPERLLRRVTFDLTGLPPTLAEIDDFLADESPGAYERVVDRLLVSKRFGERMAVAWLDAARYGDTSVFHGDGPRDMWAWRDWVINAYNDNKPFDEFTIEQLGGDLIPEATVEQRIASAFNRNNATTDEGGAIAEEFRVEYAVDRVKTTSMVWLGLTMECAQCHEHKYDPITQEEYYQFYAYFNQASDPGMQTRNSNTAPTADVPNYQTQAELAAIRQELRRTQADLDARRRDAEEEFHRWVRLAESDDSRRGQAPVDMLLHFGLNEGEGNTIQDAVDPGRQGTIHGKPQWTSGMLAGGLRCDKESFVDLGDVADFDRAAAFSYGGWIKPSENPGGAAIARMNDSDGHRGFDLHLAGGKIQIHLIHHWPDNALKVVSTEKLAPDKWQHVLITYDGSSKAAGIKIYVDGVLCQQEVERDQLTESIRTNVPLYLGRRNPGSPYQGELDDIRLYARELTANEVESLVEQARIDPLLAKSPGERIEAEVETLRVYYLSHYDEVHQRLDAEYAELKAREAAAAKPRGTVMVMGDVAEPRMTYVLQRGNYSSPQEDRPVTLGVPAALSPLPADALANRLGLARWLVAPDHPLTARVTVNRYWMMLFGTGLVASAEDFGSQGEWPSHPDLLDWLAVDFVENGWNVKRMIKQIVMSATYRQSARGTATLIAQDPANRLLARGPRFRLQGEFIRDNALATSGLLTDTIGGPSVKPYQPEGLWNAVSIDTSLRFTQDHGDKLYRRSMYIYWKRSAPPPSMAIFDAPSREKCTIRRSRTNTPLQALVTLNDPQFVEAARALAQRVITTSGTTPTAHIGTAYRIATGVRAKPAVLNVLLQAYRTELAVFQAVPDRAVALLAVGESPRDETIDAARHAAMTIVTTMILNLDETLTRG